LTVLRTEHTLQFIEASHLVFGIMISMLSPSIPHCHIRNVVFENARYEVEASAFKYIDYKLRPILGRARSFPLCLVANETKVLSRLISRPLLLLAMSDFLSQSRHFQKLNIPFH